MFYKNIPKPGANFRAKTGLSSFQRRIKSAAFYNSASPQAALKLHPKAVDALIGQVAAKENVIRQNKLTSYHVTKMRANIKKADPTLTKVSEAIIRKTLTGLTAQAAKEQSPQEKKAIIARNLARRREADSEQQNQNQLRQGTISSMNRRFIKGSATALGRRGYETTPDKLGSRNATYGSIDAKVKAAQYAKKEVKGSAIGPVKPSAKRPPLMDLAI
ncbi:hypothetical protein EPN28_00755 [Patescibacteria group bacterium]|nr:MAG: hypothetical protein EPN28_00755 [Patescibacteria group bacterium]